MGVEQSNSHSQQEIQNVIKILSILQHQSACFLKEAKHHTLKNSQSQPSFHMEKKKYVMSKFFQLKI